MTDESTHGARILKGNAVVDQQQTDGLGASADGEVHKLELVVCAGLQIDGIGLHTLPRFSAAALSRKASFLAYSSMVPWSLAITAASSDILGVALSYTSQPGCSGSCVVNMLWAEGWRETFNKRPDFSKPGRNCSKSQSTLLVAACGRE